MAYILLDESGDLGFDFDKKRTSRFFVITLLFVKDKRPVEKIVRKTHGELQKKYKRREGTLHAVKEKPITRLRLLKRLCEKECAVMTIYLDKSRVYTRLQEEKVVLYNYVTNILLDRTFTKKLIPVEEPIELIASKRETNKFLNANFKDYLNQQIKDNDKVEIDVLIKTPAEEKALQAVDFLSWAIFRKYEFGDESYYNSIKPKIVEENPLFP